MWLEEGAKVLTSGALCYLGPNPPSAIVNGGDNYDQVFANDMASPGVVAVVEAASCASE